MAGLIKFDDIPAFREMRRISPSEVSDVLLASVRGLHEADDIEEFLRAILNDRAATPHGPAEIADILTHRIQFDGADGLAAFVLKGRSYKTVRPKHISHQIYRLEKVDGLTLAVLGATGIVLDAVKEQFTSTCRRLRINYAFADANDFGRLFWAYGFLCPRDGMRIRGGRCHCGYAPKHAVLNVLQEQACAGLRDARKLGQKKGLVVLPPGSGKTRIAAQDAKAASAKSVLYVAHTHEILDVADDEFSAAFGEKSVRQLSSAEDISEVARNPTIMLSTVQYLSKHISTVQQKRFDYVVIDEFHHAAASTYKAIVRGLNYGFLLGLTATPFRADRQDIAALCDGNIIVQYELRSGVDTGILAPYHYFGCFDDIDYSDLPLQAGGYSVRDLERKLIIKERHAAVIDKWREKADGKPTLAFCCSHEHAKRVAQSFSTKGIAAASYLSSTSFPERRSLIERLRRGKLKILCVVDVLNEGADIPFAECLLFLRPTESKRIFLQQLGRGLRRYVGKSHCVVIDFIGNFRNAYKIVEYHGLRSDDFEHTVGTTGHARSRRELLDIPLGCKVTFEDRVLNIFADQSLDPRNATRENIGRILIHRYLRLSDRLGRPAAAKDVDRYELLNSTFYRRIFGSWQKFAALMHDGPMVPPVSK